MITDKLKNFKKLQKKINVLRKCMDWYWGVFKAILGHWLDKLLMSKYSTILH